MRYVSPTKLVHWLAGYDLAGQGALTEIAEKLMAMTKPVTPLGPEGEVEHEVPLGRVRYELTETGFARERQKSLRRLFADDAVDTPWPSILGQAGNAVGAACKVATDMRVKYRGLVPDLEGITQINFEYYLHKSGKVYPEALLLAAGVVEDVTDIGLVPDANYRLDGGAPSDDGGIICLMADIAASRWRGYPNLKLQVRHSDRPGSNYSNLGAAFDLERDDGKGATVIEIAPETTIKRYVSVRFTFSGARDAFALDGVHNAGVKDISVDGGAGTERIEVGDTLDIDNNDYDVADATDQGGGSWDVTLETGWPPGWPTTRLSP